MFYAYFRGRERERINSLRRCECRKNSPSPRYRLTCGALRVRCIFAFPHRTRVCSENSSFFFEPRPNVGCAPGVRLGGWLERNAADGIARFPGGHRRVSRRRQQVFVRDGGRRRAGESAEAKHTAAASHAVGNQ